MSVCSPGAAGCWPFFLGLALSVVILLIKFVQEFIHLAVTASTVTEAEAILGVLTLADLGLTGALLMIVIFSGYALSDGLSDDIKSKAHQDPASAPGGEAAKV